MRPRGAAMEVDPRRYNPRTLVIEGDLMRVRIVSSFVCLLAASLVSSGQTAASPEALARRVDAWVLDTASRGETEFLVMLRAQADLRGARSLSRRAEKGAFVLDALRYQAEM